jgi:GxxExxY protein
VHTTLGPGLLESVYVAVLGYEIHKRGLPVARQVPVAVRYDALVFEEGFRADLVIAERVIVEVKSTEATHPVHKKQLLTYLRLSGKRLGLLINFGLPLLKDGVTRVVNGLPE